MADSVPQDATAATNDLAPMFRRMLVLMEEQNKMIAEQGATLRSHGGMLEILKTDALKNDQPFEQRSLRDRLTWGVLRKEAVAKTKEKVDEWKDLMQLSLVFNAIFLTVVTAFIAPVIQEFTSTASNATIDASSNSSKPPLPPLSTQFVALFFYLALIMSILNAVLCVLGMQWASRLLAIPLGKTDLERTLAHERRKALAERKLLPLIGVLFWSLLLSIGLFIVGLLVQLWALAFACSKPAFVLIVGAAFATGLSILILGVILATTYHAAITENSPFESPLSAALRPALLWLRARTKKHAQSVAPTSARLEVDNKLGEPTVEESVRLKEDDDDSVRTLKIYARLIINTNDPEILERVVPSFEFREWYRAGEQLWPVFLAVHERFMATDTSFRVKETLHKQLVYFADWPSESEDETSGHSLRTVWETDLEGNEMTHWCMDQCQKLTKRSSESHRAFFSSWAAFLSLEPNNSDLLSPWRESYEQTLCGLLSSYDRSGSRSRLGERKDIFYSALKEFRSLLPNHDANGMTRLLHWGRYTSSTILRSLLQCPLTWVSIADVIAFMTRGSEPEVLTEMSPFFSKLPEMTTVDDEGGSQLLIYEFLYSLMLQLPPAFVVPQSLDLTSALKHFVCHYKAVEDKRSAARLPWAVYCKTLMYYLDHGGFDLMASKRSARPFFKICVEYSGPDDMSLIQARAASYLHDNHDALAPLPEGRAVISAIEAYKDDMSSKDAEQTLLDGIQHYGSLSRDRMEIGLKDILLDVNYLPLLEVLIRNPRFRVRRLSWFFSVMVEEGHEGEYLHYLSQAIAHLPWLDYSHCHHRIIEFLSRLLRYLPYDFTVPPGFDLSETVTLFMMHEPSENNWRKYSDTLLQYFNSGAFDTLSDKECIRGFLHLCINPSPKMLHWSATQQTSTSTRNGAIAFLAKLDALDLDSNFSDLSSEADQFTQFDSRVDLEVHDTEHAAPRRGYLTLPFNAFIGRLRYICGLKRTVERLGPDIDVELALRSAAQRKPASTFE
ncbi:hypothetical protein SISNIDRAFT_550672 [Sistotremastrum niveocremeum HHB9708]|uniref:DUF6535 domain-containing protein n=1 Tax=Sistotremastrum niveocremeum HHB9708 TaxID=1314777 RepID=A0A164TDP1_9AGAM|nr:hypothetical protein SISNIDRAFT_550672 [Sistotremastrum niveocremeum HHB9708]